MSELRQTQFHSLMEDTDLMEEIQRQAAAGALRGTSRFGVSGEEIADRLERGLGRPEATGASLEAMPRPSTAAPALGGLEAIVLLQGRPSLLIRNGTFEPPENAVLRRELEIARSGVEAAIARTGRIELRNHLTLDWVGTGWLVAPDIVVTNRHVAVEFGAPKVGGGFEFSTNFLGRSHEAVIDFREEFEVDAELEVRVSEILHIASDNEPDIALLRIESDHPLPAPLDLSGKEPERRTGVGVVGYPAFDTRNGLDAMRDIFGDVFDVKRFAPGKVSFPAKDEHWFVHDCSTLGGASGSPVIELDNGKAVGLHFSGKFMEGNFAVKASFVADVLASLSTSVQVPPLPGEAEAIADGRHAPEFFARRDGYDASFLGPDVPMPKLNGWAQKVAKPKGGGVALDYRHFSVVVSAERKLPLVTAVNIDGKKARRVFRDDDRWFVDLRIDEEQQLGNEIYRSNDLDRGHMVRRLDPVWGSEAEAAEANADTFHYVNAAPQHKDLNRRVWNDLEDYILDSAKAMDLKMSVFTGPVLRKGDRMYRNLVQLPQEFWKVAVIINRETEELLAAGYVLSHGEMIKDITEAPFVFGEHRTYQVQISKISEETGLGFDALIEHDALVKLAGTREGPTPRAIYLRNPRDIVI